MFRLSIRCQPANGFESGFNFYCCREWYQSAELLTEGLRVVLISTVVDIILKMSRASANSGLRVVLISTVVDSMHTDTFSLPGLRVVLISTVVD